jgi:site-specific DNA-methyltransferase (adenine-specific)
MTGMMERNKALFTNKNDDYRTPHWLWSDLNEEFKFTLDPCASAVPLASWLTNYTIEDDGLRQSWQGYRVFINPPYSNVAGWVEKSYEWMYCKQKPAEIIVMLLAARTDTG